MKTLGLFLCIFVMAAFGKSYMLNGTMPIEAEGRVQPFESFARQTMRNFSGKEMYDGMFASECIRTMIEFPDDTRDWRIFKVIRSEVITALHLPAGFRYYSYEDLKSSRALLMQYAERSDSHPVSFELKHLLRALLFYESLTQARDYERASVRVTDSSIRRILNLDSLQNIFTPESLIVKMRRTSTLPEYSALSSFTDSLMPSWQYAAENSPLRILPDTGEGKMLSGWEYVLRGIPFPDTLITSTELKRKMRTEIFYNHSRFPFWACFCAGFAFLLSLLSVAFNRERTAILSVLSLGGAALLILETLWFRFRILERPPFESLYEVLLVVVFFLSAGTVGLFFKRHLRLFLLPASAMIFILLFFAEKALIKDFSFHHFNTSFWLSAHVLTIAIGYCGMILSGIFAHVCLISPSSIRERFLHGILMFSAVFTCLGTLLGGAWADVAWGRFWGWDPKECGALFVILWSMLILHARRSHLLNSFSFSFLCAWNIVVVALCWFGINLLGAGLHSYGFQSGIAGALFGFIGMEILLIAFITKRSFRTGKNKI